MSKNDITGDSIRSKGFFSEQGEKNFDLIFGKKKSRMDVVGQNGNEGLHYEEKDVNKAWDEIKPMGKEFKYEPDDGQLTEEQYAKIKEYEYELNPSTGDVEKRFKDGVSKPNGEQFDE